MLIVVRWYRALFEGWRIDHTCHLDGLHEPKKDSKTWNNTFQFRHYLEVGSYFLLIAAFFLFQKNHITAQSKHFFFQKRALLRHLTSHAQPWRVVHYQILSSTVDNRHFLSQKLDPGELHNSQFCYLQLTAGQDHSSNN